jgi:hypothetical protein
MCRNVLTFQFCKNITAVGLPTRAGRYFCRQNANFSHIACIHNDLQIQSLPPSHLLTPPPPPRPAAHVVTKAYKTIALLLEGASQRYTEIINGTLLFSVAQGIF